MPEDSLTKRERLAPYMENFDDVHVRPVACLSQHAGGDDVQNQNYLFHFIVSVYPAIFSAWEIFPRWI